VIPIEISDEYTLAQASDVTAASKQAKQPAS